MTTVAWLPFGHILEASLLYEEGLNYGEMFPITQACLMWWLAKTHVPFLFECSHTKSHAYLGFVRMSVTVETRKINGWH